MGAARSATQPGEAAGWAAPTGEAAASALQMEVGSAVRAEELSAASALQMEVGSAVRAEELSALVWSVMAAVERAELH